ncbi:aryl-sulfate sulfotransferase, partial [Aquimarina celericrescens]|nr:aryl-sulfate sulfotransferase [Aquimarina celericrescens]
LGMELKILPNSNLLGAFQVEDQAFNFGGGGGMFKMLNFDGDELWNYTYADNNHLSHHDVEYLDNGNILFAAWNRITKEDAIALGVNTDQDIFPETIIEVNPETNEIVWKWNSFDHIIQNLDSSKTETFGVIADNPQKIDFNYNLQTSDPKVTNGNIMHCNGLFYDEKRDVIFLSILQYDEVWVIDHSTTQTEAATSSGGNYNKGGDLIYRFGNPSASNQSGEKYFYRTHSPNIIPDNYPGEGNFLIYMNGNNEHPFSIIYEFKLPEILSFDEQPEIVWSYSNPDLYYDRISSAYRLSNGNTLICEGDFGIWEVTPGGEIGWKYQNDGSTWRAHGFEVNSQELINLD